MKFLIKLVLVVMFLTIGGAYLYGRGLPREHVVTSTITLVTPPDTVFRVIRNIGAQRDWWPSVKSVERIEGARKESWRQVMGMGAGTIEVEVGRVVPGRSMETIILNAEAQGWGGKWFYDVRPTPSGTEISITEEGWVESPVFRTIMKLRGKYRTVDSYLIALGGYFGEPANPRHD
jgi:uncharacterized protein YndB with AHSA1/START domain